MTTTKKLSFLSIFLLGINGIIGSGIFLLPGQLYKDIGVASIFVILIAAIMVFFIALCYAELASKINDDGAAWRYAYEAFGTFFGFEIGLSIWFLSIVIMSAETAALLTTLQGILPIMKDPVIYSLTGVGFLLLLFIANLFGTNVVKILNNISSATKLFIILFFIIVGAFFMDFSHFTPLVPSSVTSTSILFADFGKALGVIFYAFVGFSFLPVAAAKMNHPKKNIPLALVSVLFVCTLLYTLITIVAIGILGPSISGSLLPAALAFEKALGSFGYSIIIIGMLVSIGGLAIAFSFNAPLIANSLAEKELFPKILAKKNKHNVPYISTMITFMIAIILILSGDFMFLLSVSVFISFIQYVPSIIAVPILRKRKDLPTGFKIPGGYLIPILALLSSCYLLVSFDLPVILLGVGVLLVGAIYYFISYKIKHQNKPKV